MAAQEGHEDIVDYLLKAGANQSLATEVCYVCSADKIEVQKLHD